MMKEGTKTITFRISEDLYFSIMKEADKEERSVNNLLTYIVKKYIEDQRRKK